VDIVRSLGADHVIDYTQEDFTQSGHQYDLILVMGGNHSLSELKQVLRPGGTLVPVCPSSYATCGRSHRSRTKQICNS